MGLERPQRIFVGNGEPLRTSGQEQPLETNPEASVETCSSAGVSRWQRELLPWCHGALFCDGFVGAV